MLNRSIQIFANDFRRKEHVAAFIHQVAAKVRHGPFPFSRGARGISLRRAFADILSPHNRSLMTVKNVFNCRKQNVGRERLEQVLVPTRNEADVLLRITRHLDDRLTDYLSNDSDFGITAVWENAVDDSYIYMRPS